MRIFFPPCEIMKNNLFYNVWPHVYFNSCFTSHQFVCLVLCVEVVFELVDVLTQQMCFISEIIIFTYFKLSVKYRTLFMAMCSFNNIPSSTTKKTKLLISSVSHPDLIRRMTFGMLECGEELLGKTSPEKFYRQRLKWLLDQRVTVHSPSFFPFSMEHIV